MKSPTPPGLRLAGTLSAAERIRLAYVLIGWSTLSLILVMIDAPTWLRLPIVGLYSLIGVGAAVVLALGIPLDRLALGLAIATGLSSLILFSELVMYTYRFSALLTLVLQVLSVIGLAGSVIWRALPAASRAEQPETAAAERLS